MVALLVPLDGAELLQHLIVDKLMKMGIVLLAVLAIAVGMVIIWRRSRSGQR